MQKWGRFLYRKVFGDITRQLAFPSESFSGKVVARMMQKDNEFLENRAVKLSDIGPHDRVLEVGFGPGLGIKFASWKVEEGSGRVYGVDISKYMVNRAKQFCVKQIKLDTIELHCADVTMMPFPNNLFDCVFHCNAYYFWNRMQLANDEIFRVMKPNAKLVTTLYIDGLKEMISEGELKKCNTDPLAYMTSLEASNFRDVSIKYLPYKDKLFYQAIFARKPNLEELKLIREEQLKEFEDEFEEDFEIQNNTPDFVPLNVSAGAKK